MTQQPPTATGLRPHLPFLLLLAAYIIAAVWFSFRLPAFTTPNERLHYEYVALIRQTGTLPDPATSTRMDERHQPPIYYSLVALFSWPFQEPPLDTELKPNPHLFGTPGGGNRNPFVHTSPAELPVLYVGRMVSVFFGVLACAATYFAVGKTVSRATALLAVTLMAFQPMFLFLSASLSNDLAVTAMAAVILSYTALLVHGEKGATAYLGWGILFGLALLIKATAAFLAIALAVALIAKWRASKSLSPSIRYGLAAVAGFLPIYILWILFNQQRGLDPFAVSRSLPLGPLLRVSPLEWAMVKPYLFELWQSFWLDWSTGQTFYVADWIYIAWALGLMLAIVGWAIQRHKLTLQPFLPWMYLLWMLPLVALFMSFKVLMIRDHDVLIPEGRWLLPVLPSVTWLAAVGFSRWWPANRRNRATYLAVLAPLLATTVLSLWFMPRRHPTAQHLAGLTSIPDSAEPVGLIYGGQLELAAVEPATLAAGDPVRVTVYWHVLEDIEADYSVESRIVLASAGEWHRQGAVRTYPGFGLAPTGGRQEGQVFRDAIVLDTQSDLDGPTRALIEVTLLDGQEQLPIMQNGAPVETGIALSTVMRPAEPLVVPDETLLAEPVDYSGLIELVGIESAPNGNDLNLTLWWHALAEPPQDYTVFVHALDVAGQLVTQADGMPNGGRSPTTLWREGDVIRDTYSLLGAAGASAVLVGLYDLDSLQRLPANQGDRPLTDQAYWLELP